MHQSPLEKSDFKEIKTLVYYLKCISSNFIRTKAELFDLCSVMIFLLRSMLSREVPLEIALIENGNSGWYCFELLKNSQLPTLKIL